LSLAGIGGVSVRAGVITFPGSNCDRDIAVALAACGARVERLWHGESELPALDLIVLPGGFTYGDYLRCGAIAAHSPVMREVVRRASAGVAVLGICNGFQILAEAGLVPGALISNAGLKFVCRPVALEVTSTASIFTAGYRPGQTIELPVAHHDGCYVCTKDELERLEDEDRIVLRYLDNPNGSTADIAALLGAGRNVLGIMPHPERAADPRTGSTDGRPLLRALVEALG
jgi:phosphoribosylformylglycinamidine synthase subunit PurQ / glutaminase